MSFSAGNVAAFADTQPNMAVGLGYAQMTRLVILPQALTVTIPNIVNTYIGLFKDTTLVFIVGIFDLLRTIEVARIDPKWATPVTSTTGYAVAAIFYLIFCYGMPGPGGQREDLNLVEAPMRHKVGENPAELAN